MKGECYSHYFFYLFGYVTVYACVYIACLSHEISRAFHLPLKKVNKHSALYQWIGHFSVSNKIHSVLCSSAKQLLIFLLAAFGSLGIPIQSNL